MNPFVLVLEEWLSNKSVGLSVLSSIENQLVQTVKTSETIDQAVLARLQNLVSEPV